MFDELRGIFLLLIRIFISVAAIRIRSFDYSRRKVRIAELDNHILMTICRVRIARINPEQFDGNVECPLTGLLIEILGAMMPRYKSLVLD